MLPEHRNNPTYGLPEYDLGLMGIKTSSGYNAIGYEQFRHQRAQSYPRLAASSPSAPARIPSQPYRPYAFISALEGAIPRWLSISMGVLVAATCLIACFHLGLLPPVIDRGDIHWMSLVVAGIIGFTGYGVGAALLPLLLRIVDLSLKIVMAVLVSALLLGGLYLAILVLS